LVPSENAQALGKAILAHYASDAASPHAVAAQGAAALESIHHLYGLDAVVGRYRGLFLAPVR
jgi:hypothetical protein